MLRVRSESGGLGGQVDERSHEGRCHGRPGDAANADTATLQASESSREAGSHVRVEHDQGVEAAELFGCPFDDIGANPRVGDIAGQKSDRAAFGPGQSAGDLCGIRVIAVADGDVGTLASEGDRHLSTQTRVAIGDEGLVTEKSAMPLLSGSC